MKDAANSDRFGYNIHCVPIRPMGAMNFAAKIVRIYDRKLEKDLRPELFGETYGATESEARQNMENKIREWISVQE